MKKKVVKPKTPTPIPADLEEFQSQYGGDWLNITRSPAFIAGMQLLNIRKLKSVTNLSDEQIEKNGREILADLRGHMKHEDDLFTLHAQSENSMPVEEQDYYISPEEAAALESQVDKFREARKKLIMPPRVNDGVDSIMELLSKVQWSKQGDLIVRLAKAVADDNHEQVKREIREELSCLNQ